VFESRSASARLAAATGQRMPPPSPALVRVNEASRSDRIQPGDLHLRLLEQFAPPSLVLSEEHVVIHTSPGAARFMQVPAGEPSRDVFRLVHPDLRADLRSALRLAAQRREAVEVNGLRVERLDGSVTVRLTVKPVLRDGDVPRGYFLVLLDEDAAAPPAPPIRTRLAAETESESNALEEELTRTRDQLRHKIEEYETQAEEEKASNEELQAMNEELRSAAEELETSKEELQSVNEELTTVNQELKVKVEELALSNNDLHNLINSTQVSAVFLDTALRVKLATPAAQPVFNLLRSDVGRKLSDLTTRLEYETLHADVARVLADLQPIEREVHVIDDGWSTVRIVPYRTSDDRIDGVVITLQDVTTRREAEERRRAEERRLRLLVDRAVDYAIFTMDTDGRIDSWNTGAERMFGYSAAEAIGQSSDILFTPEDRAAGAPATELDRARKTGRAEDERWHMRKDGTRFYCSGVTTSLGEPDRFGFAKIARDLTAHRQSAGELEEARAQLEERVRQRTAELQAEVKRHSEAQAHVTLLLRRAVTSQEEQSARIARDLHDQLGQQLTALRLTIEGHREQCKASGDGTMDRALTMTRDIDNAIDFLAWELRPAALDDLGLTTALPRFVEEWSAHYGVSAQCHVTGSLAGALPPEAEVTFYRVAQEALNNVLKHAHASRADVVLEGRDGAVVLIVEDDGVGFDPNDRRVREVGMGLVGMRERAALIGASFEVESAPDQGTTVFLRYQPTADGKGARV
jgi:PAS domain S-box-containing protein